MRTNSLIRAEYDKNALNISLTVIKIFLKEGDLPVKAVMNGYS